MSEQTEDRTPPATWEEYQRDLQFARREGFIRGGRAAIQRGLRQHQLGEEACQLYPITRKVPRTVTLAGGGIVRAELDGFLRFENPNGSPMSLTAIGSASVEALRDLLNRPYDEVTE